VRARRCANDSFTVEIDGRLEASLQDPDADGERLARHFSELAQAASASRLVILGIGVHSLRHLAFFEGEILVIEPDLEVARTVLEHIDLSQFLARHALVVDPRLERSFGHPLFTAASAGLFLSHATTRRRHPEFHDELAARFHPGGDLAPLDIAVIPPLYGGSLPVAHAVTRALRALGHHVRDIDLSAFWPAYQELFRVGSDLRLAKRAEELRSALVRVIGETLLTEFWAEPPDVVFALAQAPLDLTALENLRERGILRAFWFCEDAHVMPYWKQVAPYYDVFFHLQPDVLTEPLRDLGVYAQPLPMAFDPAMHRPIELTSAERQRYACDLSFVGAAYHNRVEFLPGLFDLGLRLYGTGWPPVAPYLGASPELNQRQSSEACNLIFNASRINLNLHSSPWTEGVNPSGDYLNPRCFEIAGAGGFQLVDERRELARFFDTGAEVETFRDLNECRKKIVYFRDHPDERREIAERSRKRALECHTYEHRLKLAVDALRSGPTPALSRKRSTPTVGRALASLRDSEPAVARILERLPLESKLDQEALYRAVASGTGDLSYEEKLLLFMREAMTEIQILNAAGDPA